VRLDRRQLKFAQKTHKLQRTISLSISNRVKAAAGIGFVFFCVVFLVKDVGAKTSNDTSLHRELYYEDIKSLQQQLTHGSLTARQLLTLFIERIHALDRAGLSIHPVIELNPDALAIASKIDGGSAHGLLHGIPILVKTISTQVIAFSRA
jgi:hypothetical protein